MTAKLTAAEIAEARELIAKATPGPWEVFYWDGHYTLHCGDVGDCGGDPEDGWGCVYGYAQRDGINLGKVAGAEDRAAFIAASRLGWPAALDALEEANKRADEAQHTVEMYDDNLTKCCRAQDCKLAEGEGTLLGRALKAESSLAASDAARRKVEGLLADALKALDGLKREHCEDEAGQEGSPETEREVCQQTWPSDADRLFPDGEVK